jgi:hypothetical protein
MKGECEKHVFNLAHFRQSHSILRTDDEASSNRRARCALTHHEKSAGRSEVEKKYFASIKWQKLFRIYNDHGRIVS